MPNMKNNKRLIKHKESFANKGFTLVELSVVVTIIALIIGSAISGAVQVLENKKESSTKVKLKYINEVISEYQNTQGKLPCPANITIASSALNFGIENCAGASGGIYSGMVPVRELGIPDEYSYDAWGNRIAYIATENHTTTGNYSGNPSVIVIQDAAANPLISAAYGGAASYVLLSYGDNGAGARKYRTAATDVACIASTVEEENCDGDIVFTDVEYAKSDVATKYFDDYIIWSTKRLTTSASSVPKQWYGISAVEYSNDRYSEIGDYALFDGDGDSATPDSAGSQEVGMFYTNRYEDTNNYRGGRYVSFHEEEYAAHEPYGAGLFQDYDHASSTWDPYLFMIPAGITKAEITFSGNLIGIYQNAGCEIHSSPDYFTATAYPYVVGVSSGYGIPGYNRVYKVLEKNPAYNENGGGDDCTPGVTDYCNNRVLTQIDFSPNTPTDIVLAPGVNTTPPEIKHFSSTTTIDKASADTMSYMAWCRGGVRHLRFTINVIECDNGTCLYKE